MGLGRYMLERLQLGKNFCRSTIDPVRAFTPLLSGKNGSGVDLDGKAIMGSDGFFLYVQIPLLFVVYNTTIICVQFFWCIFDY